MFVAFKEAVVLLMALQRIVLAWMFPETTHTRAALGALRAGAKGAGVRIVLSPRAVLVFKSIVITVAADHGQLAMPERKRFSCAFFMVTMPALASVLTSSRSPLSAACMNSVVARRAVSAGPMSPWSAELLPA